MPGGPIYPYSAIPVTADRVFPYVIVPGSGTWTHEMGMGVQASLGADAIWRLAFEMPPTELPSGTGKLRLRARANAATGVAKVNPKWASVAMTENPAAATLQAETVQTVTWSTGDEYKYKELKVNLDADTLIAGEIAVVDLTFETASWTLAQISLWLASIIWE